MNITENLKLYYKALREVCLLHKDQVYDKEVGYPYMIHLISVTEVLTRFGFTSHEFPDLHIAGLFHDAIEDQGKSYKELEKDYGKEVADIVWLCTDDIVLTSKGAPRHERHAVTYPRIAKNINAVIVKMCDRISNVEYGISVNNLSQYRKYRREYKFFRETLKTDNVLTQNMWKHLDQLFDWT
jgi:(p)ppGpp synthase/HD superfamily hydrolase